MKQEMILAPNAFYVRFHNFNRWDPVSYHEINWQWPEELMMPIGKILTCRKEKVDRVKNGFSDLMPITIHFDGSIEKRKVDPQKEYSMDLFWAYPGDVVISKIDLKNGAVSILPDSWKNVVVTGHFAVYVPNKNLIIPEYFTRIIQTSFFKNYLWRNKVGAEGRKEVKLDFFESIAIPVPPLEIQKTIIEYWSGIKKTIASNEEKINLIELEIVDRFFSCLGLSISNVAIPQKSFFISWRAFDRWSINYNLARQKAIDLSLGKYPGVFIGSLLEKVQYGTSKKAYKETIGLPVIRMNNISDSRLDLSDMKYIAISESEKTALLLKDGDILFNRTNSKELVGKCAVFHENGDYIFASYLIRMRVNIKKANPDFIAYVINSPIGRRQIDALSRQIIGQANINSQEIRSLQVPLPPLEIQNAIMDFVSIKKTEIDGFRNALELLSQMGKLELEEMILGSRSVEDSSA